MVLCSACNSLGDKHTPKKEVKIVNNLEAKINIPNTDFSVDAFEVSIAQFKQFTQANEYVTTADSLEWSGVFDTLSNKWEVVEKANWLRPEGNEIYSDNYPTTQVSFYDACAYCEWKSGRIPTAQEWDIIAGPEVIRGNIWEGVFPYQDEAKDGYYKRVAPIGQFKTNKYGIHDLFGNVWEWTSSLANNGSNIIKGGSFLCDFDVCSGFIPSKFQTTPKDSGLNHLGFRCIYDN